MKKVLLTSGDSWTFGSEIAAPELLASPGEIGYGLSNRFKKDRSCFEPANDYYRIPRTWSSYLAQNMNAESVNISWPSRSNDSIYNSIMGWVMREYIIPKKDTSDLTIVVGWSSPERKDAIVEDEQGFISYFTIWPNLGKSEFYPGIVEKKLAEFHVKHMWIEFEYISRFVGQAHNLWMFCQLYDIKLRMFNSFYVPRSLDSKPTRFEEWSDTSFTRLLDSWTQIANTRIRPICDGVHQAKEEVQRVRDTWSSIPEDVFLLKDEKSNTFKSFIEENIVKENRWTGIHPSPESHKTWAEFLYKYV